MTGAPADADRAVVNGAEQVVSAVPASVPSAGDWVIVRGWSLQYREVLKVTPKLLKLGAGSSRYPTQIGRSGADIVGFVPDREIAAKIVMSIAGADGEYRRRCNAARADYDARCGKAQQARDNAVDRLLAQAMSAGTAETQSGSGRQPASAVRQDAPETPLSTPLPSGSIER